MTGCLSPHVCPCVELAIFPGSTAAFIPRQLRLAEVELCVLKREGSAIAATVGRRFPGFAD